MAVVRLLKVQLDQRPDSLAVLLSELAKKAINITAIQKSEAKGGNELRLLLSANDVAQKICDGLGLRHAEEEALAVQLAERPGALGRVMRKLAAGRIKVKYVYGTIERGSQRAMVVLGVDDPEAASRILR